MNEIIAEFHYWDYGDFNRTAMEIRPQIQAEELMAIAQQFDVHVKVEKIRASYFPLMRFSSRAVSYGKFIIRVSGTNVDAIKTCVGKIFIRYGRPDEVPMAFFGSKGAGKVIINTLLKDFKRGKR